MPSFVKWSIDSLLPELHSMTPSANQDCCHSRTQFNILILDPMVNSLKKILVWEHSLNRNKTLMKWSLGGPLSELYPMTPPANQDGRRSRTQVNIGPYGKFILKSSCLDLLAQLEPNFGGMVLGWSPFRIVSGVLIGHPIWPLLLKIEKKGWFLKKSSPPKPFSQLMPNFGGMVLRWSSFRIVSDDPARQPRWPPQRNLV